MAKTNITLQDIEDLETLMGNITATKQYSLEQNKEPVYTIAIKKETVRLRFKLGVGNKEMNSELGLTAGTCETWCIKHPASKIHVISQQHGNTIRYDVPTKAKVVQMHLEDGIPIHKLAEEYGVSQPAVSTWKKQYKDCYKDYVHGLEGTLVIGKEEKRVTGLANARKIQLIAEQAAQVVKQAVITLSSLEHDTTSVTNAMTILEEVNNSFKTT